LANVVERYTGGDNTKPSFRIPTKREEGEFMNANKIALALACGSLLTFAGCKKSADSTPNFKTAIDNYYLTRPACLWHAPKQFPIQVDTKGNPDTTQYDALFDQGLLTRTTAEKQKLIVLSKQVTNYDLSANGRAAWTADTQQPGFGNFCYGHWQVSSVDSNTPTTDKPGATTTVNYHVALSGAPGWASAPETQNAFPEIQQNMAGPVAAVATLTDFDKGWAVTTGPAGENSHPVTNTDGSIVQ